MKLHTKMVASMFAAMLVFSVGCSTAEDGLAADVTDIPAVTESEPTPAAETSPADGEGAAVEQEPTTPLPPETPGQNENHGEGAGGAVDAATLAWTDALCEDMTVMMDALFQAPAADESSPVAEYRDAHRANFESIGDVVSAVATDASTRQPPGISDGEKLHEAYLEYVGDYVTATSEGISSIDQAGDSADSVMTAINDVHDELDRLSMRNFGPDVTDDPMMEAAMDIAPACQMLG